MFNEAEPPCSYDFDVLYSLIADIGLHNVRSVPKADVKVASSYLSATGAYMVSFNYQHQHQHWTDEQSGIIRWSLSLAGACPELIKVEIPAMGELTIPASANEHLSGQTFGC